MTKNAAEQSKKWGVKYLPPNHRYPYDGKIQLNLLYILSIVSGINPIKDKLANKRKMPKTSGVITPYPRPEFIELTLISILKELLIETAVFIRGHDDFWGKKDGKKWSDFIKDPCGSSWFTGKGLNEKRVNLDLRAACDKLIHAHTTNWGYEGDETSHCFILHGDINGKDWQAILRLEDFCYTALRLMFPSS